MDPQTYINSNKDRFLNAFIEFLKIKSISTDPKYEPEMAKARSWLKDKLTSLGFTNIKELKLKDPKYNNRHAIVYAEYTIDSKLPTLLVYGHYDVQPITNPELWKSDPFNPVVKDGKVYARGANDNKGAVIANLMAIEYYIKHVPDDKKKYNLKVFYEGEEEIGSKGTIACIKSGKFSKELQSDYAYVVDGSWISNDKPTIVYSLRGTCYFDLYLKVLDHNIHSGIYGNAVLNAANLAGYVIYKLKDILTNQIKIPGIYDDVREPSKDELELIKLGSPKWSQIKNEVNSRYVTSYFKDKKDVPVLFLTGSLPSLDVHGIYSGFVKKGERNTIIPAEALVKFSIRIVPNMDNQKLKRMLKDYLSKIIPSGVEWELKDLGMASAYLMDPNDKSIKKLVKAMQDGFNKKPVVIPGSVCIGLVVELVKNYGHKVLMPTYGLPDDGLHSPNEKFNIDQIWGGAKTFINFLTD